MQSVTPTILLVGMKSVSYLPVSCSTLFGTHARIGKESPSRYFCEVVHCRYGRCRLLLDVVCRDGHVICDTSYALSFQSGGTARESRTGTWLVSPA